MCRGAADWLNRRMRRHGETVAWRWGVAWMLVFAAVHVYWGFGGTALLPAGVSVLDSGGRFVATLVAIPLCLAAAALAWLLRPVQHPRRLLARRWLLWPGTVGSAVVLALGLHDHAWLPGGLLLAATVTSYRQAVRRTQSLQRNRREASAVATTPQTAITNHSPSSA